MKRDQQGFSIVEMLIVFLAAGLLVAVGWLVYDRQKDNNNNQQTSTQASEQEKQESKQTDPYEEWVAYSKNKYEFKYPSDWSLEEQGETSIRLESPDFESTGLQTESIATGALLVAYPPMQNSGVTADNFQSSSLWSSSYAGFKAVEVNGQKAVQYNIGSDVLAWYIFNGSSNEHVQYQFPEGKQGSYLDVVNLFLATLKVNS